MLDKIEGKSGQGMEMEVGIVLARNNAEEEANCPCIVFLTIPTVKSALFANPSYLDLDLL